MFRRRRERRLPVNADLRRRFEQERKVQAQDDLAQAQRLTEQTSQRIDRLRDIARVLDMRKR